MKKVFLVVLSVALIITGCENVDFGDTNKNVNGPTEASTSSLLSGAITNFATRQGRPYCITPTLNVQYFMQLVYNDEMLYANTPGFWTSYYVQRLSNLELVIELCSAEGAANDISLTANGNVSNQKAVAMIFKSLIFKRVTDLFGDVPYSKALTVESLTPEYDTQEEIYAGLIADVKAARDMINVSAAGPTGDVIYNGDMTKWVKFANSFLLQLSLQLSEVDGVSDIDAAGEFAAALAHSGGVIETLDDEAWFMPDLENGFDNPWTWMRPADYGVTQEMISSMKGAGDNKVTSNTTADERLQFIVEDVTAAGLPYGYLEYADNQAGVNPIVIDAGTSLPFLTAGYTYLNRAEGASRGWSSEVVDDMLESGIMASYARFDAMYNDGTYTIGDGSAYAAARVADAGTVGEIQVIAEEKWVALFPLGFDAWSEWRRTDFPALLPAPDAINDGTIARRYNYPSDEATLNTTNYEAGVSGLTPAQDNNSARVWWDQ